MMQLGIGAGVIRRKGGALAHPFFVDSPVVTGMC